MLNQLTKRPIRHERGQALVATTCLIVALIGFAALATDVGYMYSVRRHMQSAADAAALAAANQLNTSAATDVASLNGFTSSNSTITVSSTTTPPTGAPTGTYYSVQISQEVPTFFLRVLGYTTMKVSTTTAEAGNADNSGDVTAVNGSGSGIIVDSGASVTVGGSSSTQQGGCGVISNAGLTNSGTITAPAVGVVGSVTGTTPTHTTTGIAPITDPVAPCLASAISQGGIAANTCTLVTKTTTGTYNCSKTQTITPVVYDGSASTSSEACGYVCTKSNISVTFNTAGGTCGNRISCGANDQTSYPISNTTCTLNAGTYQCSTSHGYGYGGSHATCSLEVGTNASNCTVTCNSGSGSYTFLGNVSCSGSNTVNLQPGTYCGGITVTGTSGAAPTVNFAPGTYYIGGGGLNCTGSCTLKGTGCTFYNTSDPSSLGLSSGPISIGPNTTDNVSCSFSAPTSGSCKGLLLCQDSGISGSGSGWYHSSGSGSTSKCSVQGCSGSTFNGAVYTPGATLKYCGSSSPSSSHGYTILAADSLELTSGASMQVSCDYATLTNGMSPITTAGLYQ
jgi:Flp pilus assembly protein TadG